MAVDAAHIKSKDKWLFSYSLSFFAESAWGTAITTWFRPLKSLPCS